MFLSALHTVVRGLVRRTWLVTLVAVIACAGFAAHAVAALVEADYLTTTPKGVSTPRTQVRPVEPARAAPDGSVLVERNIFCSSCTPSTGPGPTNTSYAGEPAVLIATSVGKASRATVRVISSGAQGSWGLGDQIPGVGTIERIGSVSIDVIDRAGVRGQLSLLDSQAAASVAPRAATRGPTRAAADPFADRIKKLSDSEFEVDRTLVRELVGGTTKPGGTRALPMMKGNEVQGIRLLGVRSGSIGAAVGLRSNDVITAVDGEPIKTAQQLLDLYSKLDRLAAVELTGTRRGKPLALTLRLR